MNPSWPPAGSPGPPPGYSSSGAPRLGRRRWLVVCALLTAGTLFGGLVATVITTKAASEQVSSTERPPATVTVTAAPSKPAPPAPLPTALADRQTCNAWHAADDKIRAAATAQSVIPKGMTILDQAVKDNPAWSSAVQQAAQLYDQAGDTLTAGIAPGTTIFLKQAATTAYSSLHALATGFATLDALNGNAFDAMHDSSDLMDMLCDRLAPR